MDTFSLPAVFALPGVEKETCEFCGNHAPIVWRNKTKMCDECSAYVGYINHSGGVIVSSS